MKLQKMGDKQYFVTIPKAIIKALKWKKGDIVDWNINNKSLGLVRKSK